MFSIKNKLINQNEFSQLCKRLGLLLSNAHKVVIDSRKVMAGDIFCAYPGTLVDGRDYVHSVLNKSPSAIILESGRDIDTGNIPTFKIHSLMNYIGLLAAQIENYPSTKMQVIGVTGTNGKTSISHWLNQALNLCSQKTAIIGTTGCGIYPDVMDYASTTPDPVTLQNLVHNFAEKNVDTLVMEVSSHALHQGRVNGMTFDIAIFTNLTQDHLDYHHTMEEYYQSKADLFYWHGLKQAIINIDDEYGVRLIKELKQNLPNLQVISYGINDGDIFTKNIKMTLQGISFTLVYNASEIEIVAPILGEFNISNLLSVFAVLICNGIKLSDLAEIANNLKSVIGRMDANIVKDAPLVVVDYSHTPDSLEKAILSLQEIPHKKLHCVFGCGGNRDKTKRSIMGAIASQLSDSIIVTNDNPRNEDPQLIIDEILTGIKIANYQVIPSREDAIKTAIMDADIEDIVLIAGKGHEDYQEIAGVKHHFSDLEIRDKYLELYIK
ncbi:MAG: UDP-N-acetylmuramoyl-L-alanyl-D-glutamate--2,6-diaminopimelate ligase [Burkholderiales bacterium]|nr:UDP-N-acetylmuramoyl-L-alanyl-D-glutamate--2,6-diaminopimelate ligase [Burkholderiales bacterium]